ncbi:Hypothetical predicted protein [Mytilus galloprovincialis]|uniref:Methyltransferase FkbM domain-containing protein n=1 Tax=Mytilus galloprovincialis TaxID=29158 RepID=A0A8B6BS47_MYTGA|nr:Hypothetical predicted protein [Mytilus galloprovincialis]
MQIISKGCVMISLVVAFILFLFYVNTFQDTRKYESKNTKKQKFTFDILDIAKTNNNANLYTKEEAIKTPVVVKGKGNYKLKNPNGVKQDIISWSQYGQDKFLDKLFNKKQNGFFVEIGGYDGESFSNTLFLEKIRDWDGLLVEASPFLYNIMLKKDRKCYMVNACISTSLPTMTFVLAGGITSAKETLTDMHQRRIARDRITYGKYPNWANTNDTATVNCFPLLQLMKILGRTNIDYFSLDVEGAEMHILNSISWKEINIDVFTIETDQHRDQILNFMRIKGYKWIHKLRGDDIFVKNKSVE